MAEALVEHKTPFVDLNNDDLIVRPNAGRVRVEDVPPAKCGHELAPGRRGMPATRGWGR